MSTKNTRRRPRLGDAGDIEWIRRTRVDGITLAVATAVLLVATLVTEKPPASWEVSLFRTINDLPRQAEWILWPLQQAGMALAVPVGAVVLWLVVRHWRPPVTLIAGGIVFGWGGAKLIKEWVDRGRPGSLLDDVSFGYDVPVDGFGYPSGHAVVVFTLATVFAPYVGRRTRWALYGLGILVVFSRIYMGAHMPLDVIGGAAYGIAIGAAINLTAGVRSDRTVSHGVAVQ